MSSKDKTKTIINEIVKKEEERYGITIDVEIPTIIEYYADNLKKGSFNPIKQGKLNAIISAITGVNVYGLTLDYQNIIVMNNGDRTFCEFMRLPLKYIGKTLPLKDISIVKTTFHEVWHILERNFKIPSAYVEICCDYLSDYEGLKGHLNHRFHDSLFSEMCANYYGASEAKKYFSGDKDIEEYIDSFVGKYAFQILTYDFDSAFEKYRNKAEKEIASTEMVSGFQQVFWDYDGRFKRPKEIFSNPRLEDLFKNNDYDKLFYRVISSDSYLSSLNIADLELDEIEFVSNAIKNNNKFLVIDKGFIYSLYNQGLIDEEKLDFAISLIDDRIGKKEEFRLQFTDGKIAEEDIPVDMNINFQRLLEKSFEVEKPKKVKSISSAKQNIKETMNIIKELPVFVAASIATIALEPLICGMVDDPFVAGSIASSMLATPMLASFLPRYNGKDKNKKNK